jgi:hypothetical protein
MASNGFKFESKAYQSGFGKPIIFDKKILEAHRQGTKLSWRELSFAVDDSAVF